MIHLVLSSNENYADGMLVTVASTLKSLNQQTDITIHFLNGGISKKTRARLDNICNTVHKRCILDNIQIDETTFKGFKPGPGNSLMTYARLLMGSILKDVEKVIYIDVDFLVLKDLQILWDRDMKGKIAWACQDITIPYLDGQTPLPVLDNEKKWPYFNAGFLLIDLKKWRERNLEKKSLKLGLTAQSGLHDQAILNYLLKSDVGFLEEEWNWQSPNVIIDGKVRIANYHFIWVKKPWMHFRTTLNYRLWRHYYMIYAEGSMIELISRIGVKKILIGIREILLRSSPTLLTWYLKMVGVKLGYSSSEYLGIRDYYQASTTAYTISAEKKAFSAFANS